LFINNNIVIDVTKTKEKAKAKETTFTMNDIMAPLSETPVEIEKIKFTTVINESDMSTPHPFPCRPR
jgi:hypothetical protein